MSKSIKITSKRDAMRQSLNTLFAGPKTATRVWPYCTGKYKWHGSAAHYIGQVLEVSDDVVAVWVERRTDTHGAYAKMMCLSY